MKIHYVYVVFRPDGSPCYVGKGKGDRCLQHLKSSHNPRLAGVIKKAGGDVPIVKVRQHLTDAEAMEIEIALIAVIGRADLGTGPLLNLTIGGDGVVGHKRTPEQRMQMSIARKGTRVSPEAAAKVSAKLKGVPKSPEHCAAVSAAKKGKPGKPQSQETKDKRANSLRGQKRSDEALEKMRAAAEALKNDPVRSAARSAKVTAALTGRKLSPQHCAKISAVQKGKPKGPMKEITKLRLSISKRMKR